MRNRLKPGVCRSCRRLRGLIAKDMCCTCYRAGITTTCRDCGRVARHEADGRCWTCDQRHRNGMTPVLLQYFGPRVHEPIVARPRPLDEAERRALADVAIIWSGGYLPPDPLLRRVPPEKQRGPRGKGNGRTCLDCGAFGAQLRYGNRCDPCYRSIVAAT